MTVLKFKQFVNEKVNEYQGGPLEGESDWTYGDSVETAGGQRNKEMKNIAPFLKELGVKDLHKLAMIADTTGDQRGAFDWDDKKWKAGETRRPIPGGSKIGNSEVYDTVEIGTYDGKPAIVGNSDGDLFVFVKESLNEKINMRDVKLIKKHFAHSEQNIADWDIVGDNDEITVKGPNPYDDGHQYTWYWDGENVWTETDAPSGAEWSKPVKDVDAFIELMDNGELNDGGEWE
jgi:hypothetical protein